MDYSWDSEEPELPKKSVWLNRLQDQIREYEDHRRRAEEERQKQMMFLRGQHDHSHVIMASTPHGPNPYYQTSIDNTSERPSFEYKYSTTPQTTRQELQSEVDGWLAGVM